MFQWAGCCTAPVPSPSDSPYGAGKSQCVYCTLAVIWTRFIEGNQEEQLAMLKTILTVPLCKFELKVPN